ncbi:hypothetical protein [Sporomusa acidovorans]|uniref:Outer membrane protein (OmpH-like) n=1 Tax=Sporomusa acidovorans (strain ATCC 49682 / DSM 3132 / Mol) TaxID=1123286 RepID=A0ABZ3J745_SPOA4|nr:hypothetical protein [Sporomusa acidovorans]OZC19286.1 outer membrane protein (OmpH-like) [Sporomusa acidovorans DSM 3132]SDD81897.1 hypothetical protein SAMN04488499_1004142 [Sporomusa acidovorans]
MFITEMRITPTRFLVILALSTILVTGCSRSTPPETKPPEMPQVGVINMDKAISAHPKFQEWQKLKQQAATLRQQLAGQAVAAADAQETSPAMDLPNKAAAGLQATAEQEFNAKMVAKQRELADQLAEKADKARATLNAEYQAYAQEVEKEYQPQLFSYQLKLQTIKLDEKQTADIKKAMDDLKAEQAGKLAAKEKELGQSLEAAMAPEKAATEQQLAAYAKQLNAELKAKTAAQTNAMSAPIPPTINSSTDNAAAVELKQQFDRKQQEINALEEYIVNDIRDKAAKVAIEHRLDVVLTGYQVNVTAVDITAEVIAAFNK